MRALPVTPAGLNHGSLWPTRNDPPFTRSSKNRLSPWIVDASSSSPTDAMSAFART